MATSTEDLKGHLKRVQDRAMALNWQDKITVLATPEPSLQTELGPLTTKLESEKTKQCAAVMALEFKNDVGFQSQLRSIRNDLNLSTISSGNGGAETLFALGEAINALRGAITTIGKAELEKKAPPSPLVKVLDALLAQSLMAVPYAGPFLSAAAQNAGTLLSAGVASGFQAITNYALTPPPKDESTLATVLGGTTLTSGVGSGLIQDAGKGLSAAIAKNAPVLGGYDGAVSFFYGLWQARQERNKNKEIDAIVQGGNLDQQVDIVRIMSAQTQNQVVTNRIYDRLFSTVRPDVEERKLESLLNKKSDTIKQYYDKVPETLNAYRQYVLALMYASIVESLNDEITALRQEVTTLATAKRVPPPTFMAASADKKFEAASTLVMGYYFYRYIKNNPLHNAALLAIMRKYYPGWTITASVPGGGLTAMLPTLNPESQAIAKAFINTQQFKSVIEAPQDGRIWSAPTGPVINDAIDTAGTSAGRYFGLLKSSLSNTLAKNLRRGETNTPSISDIVRLVAVCSLIVNEVLGAVARKKSFSYQDSWIDTLAELNFVAKYSKWFGQISEAKKREVTGHGSASAGNYRLRFPGSLPSDAERTMIYMFASVVVMNVDLGKIVTGTQNWDKVKDNLYVTIGIINSAEL
ncbi:hypothetical protein [Azorhizobium sp. AG788]|uniref:hypothetical protein n=1 Tax=Azorhizobium sp. AG788 TaxID=2183897 RepID=UPI00313A2410